jgi:hypothetical protein
MGLGLGLVIGTIWLLSQRPNFAADSTWVRCQYVAVILILGLATFLLRQRRRLFYGWLEVGAAFAFAWQLTNPMAGTGERLLTLLASLLAFVSGFDNVDQGFRERKAGSKAAQR